MQTINETPKKPVTYYGKKVYYMKAVIAPMVIAPKKKPLLWYEDIEEDPDK